MPKLRHTLFLLSLLGSTGASAATYTFTPFQVPGAASTTVAGLNDLNRMTGQWSDSNNKVHGFVSEAGGFTVIDAPGASMTVAAGINNAGTVVGTYTTTGPHGLTNNGYVLSQGVITTRDVAGRDFTVGNAINAAGTIAVSALEHGTLTEYTSRKSHFMQIATVQNQAVAINAGGTVIGSTYVVAKGMVSAIQIPNAGFVAATGLNASGTVVGYFYDTTAKRVKGFILRKGKIRVVTRPGFKETFLDGINDSGVICGVSTDMLVRQADAFVYSDSTFISIAPGEQAFPIAINASGNVAGVVGNQGFLATLVGD